MKELPAGGVYIPTLALPQRHRIRRDALQQPCELIDSLSRWPAERRCIGALGVPAQFVVWDEIDLARDASRQL